MKKKTTGRKRGRPKIKDKVPYEKQVKEFTWHKINGPFAVEMNKLFNRRVFDSLPEEAWVRGYDAAKEDALKAIHALTFKGLIRTNVALHTAEAFRLSQIKADKGLEGFVKGIGQRDFEKAPEDYRKKHREPDKVDEFKRIISGKRSIPEKELAKELGVPVDHLPAILEEAKRRHVIKSWLRFKGAIDYER